LSICIAPDFGPRSFIMNFRIGGITKLLKGEGIRDIS
jgi:hypothetical protein